MVMDITSICVGISITHTQHKAVWGFEMYARHNIDHWFQDILHLRIKENSLDADRKNRDDCAQELCKRINSLSSKSDDELEALGISRREIGSQIIQDLLN